MTLKMRPTGLSSGAKDEVDYCVFCGEWCIGRIYKNRGGPESLRWFWALHAPGGRETLRSSNRVVAPCPRCGATMKVVGARVLDFYRRCGSCSTLASPMPDGWKCDEACLRLHLAATHEPRGLHRVIISVAVTARTA
jgi:hypothetical protein